MDLIKNQFDSYNKEDFEDEVKKIFELQIKNEPKPQIAYEGYFRKNLNLDIELERDEIFSGNKKKFLGENNEEIGEFTMLGVFELVWWIKLGLAVGIVVGFMTLITLFITWLHGE